ncbi:MAG: hypothetical protein HWN67_00325 [Candidatus Helarchaeota archaeon]|nr:hypothetical protein [Candidatus Helarchaeota archaeon]
MKNIAYYITTHGLGHATRSIAIIRELLKDPKLQIYICSKLPKNYLNGCFHSNSIKFHESDTLFGVRYKELLQVDIEKSIDIFRDGIKKQEKYIEKELEFCKKNNIDLIICDICPFPFDVADKLKIPSIAISNFDWYTIFKHIINQKKSHDLYENLEILRESYEKADLLLRLPFSIDMKFFKKKLNVSLVVRELTRDKTEIRSVFNLEEDVLLIFYGLTDYTFTTDELIKKFDILNTKHKELKIFFSKFLKKYIPKREYFRFILEEDQESQDYVAASDLVIGKVGYGTVSECVAYKKPLIYTTRKDFLEDIGLAKGIEMFGKGKYYTPKALLNGEFENLVNLTYELSKKSISNEIAINGALEVFQIIKKFI